MTVAESSTETVARAFLIADIRGYTNFTRTQGDAAAGRLAGTFASLARLAVVARGGEVLELRGDEVLAVFEDPAEAARAAVELQALCAEDAERSPGFGFPVGVGLDFGDVVPVEGGFRGAAINLAARLCSKAEAGEVLATRKLIDLTGDVDVALVEAREPVEVKGYAEPVPLVALRLHPLGTPESGPAAPVPAELDPFVPLVGRESELNWLLGTWRQARRGRGRVVAISGVEGIGKTRLAAELACRSEAVQLRYAGAGGAGAAIAMAAVHAASNTDAPMLVVLDDLHLYPHVVAQLLDATPAIEDRAALVVAAFRSADEDPGLQHLVSRVDTRRDGHRRLSALSPDEVRAVIALYAGADVDDAPLQEMTRASAGVPGTLHELASDWARDEAKRRMSAAAEWIAESRAKQTSGLDFANNLIALRLGRIFGEQTPVEEDRCPYQGLAPFAASDAAYFYGRERLVGDLAARSVGSGLLTVVGPSGSGKSSVVMAGLLPSLAGGLLPGSDRWVQTCMRPGAHPLETLETALPVHQSERLVLVVDQFEETFTTCVDEEERSAFIGRLVELATDPDRTLVIVTVRADYTGHCTPYPELADLVADNIVLVGPMTVDEVKRVIELPARRAGLRVESALVSALVDEVGDEPGGLPLLSTALVELWQHRDDGWLRFSSYEQTGGVRGAVARLAEASYDELPEQQQQVARNLLLRLIGEGEGEAAVRRRVPLGEFDDDAEVISVLTRLTEDRLLTRDDDQVEIAHEALIREWPRLGRWLEEDATGRQLRRHVTQAAKTWEARGRDDADLYRGARLTATLDWAGAHATELNQLEREFVESSRRTSVRDADKQRRTNRRLRGLLVGTALFLAVALVAALLAVVQRGHARTAAQEAEAQALTSDAERLGALALSETQPDKALLLAAAGYELDHRAQTRNDLFSVLERSPALVHVTYPSQGSQDAVAVSPDGKTVAVSSSVGTVRFYDAHTFEPVGRAQNLDHEGLQHQAMSFTPDGRFLVVGSSGDGISHAWVVSAATGQVARRLTWHIGESVVPAVSPDGRQLAVLREYGGPDPTEPPVTVVDTFAFPSLTPLRTIHFPTDEFGRFFEQIEYLNNHQLVASLQNPLAEAGAFQQATGSHHTLLINTRSGHVSVAAEDGGVMDIAPDRRSVVVGTGDSGLQSIGRVFIIDPRTGKEQELAGAAGMERLDSVEFSPDGATVLAGGENGTLRLLDAKSGSLVADLSGAAGPVDDIAFSRNGAVAFTAGADGTLMTWDLSGGHRLGQTMHWGIPADTCSQQPCFDISPKGDLMAMPDAAFSRVRLFDPQRFRSVRVFDTPDGPVTTGVSFSRDGKLLATSGSGGTVTLWRMPDAHPVLHLRPAGAAPTLVAFSPTDDVLATLDATSATYSVVQLWDASSGKQLQRWRVKPGLGTMVFAPDGRTVVTVTGQGSESVQIHDVATGEAVPGPTLDQTATSAAFADDTGMLAIAEYDGTVLFWDVNRQREVAPPLPVSSTFSYGIALSPDGTFLANDTFAPDASLWDLRSRSQMGDPLPDAPGQAGMPQFLDNGHLIELYNGEGVKWPTSPDTWLDFACNAAGRDMTPAEWQDLLPNRPYQHVCPQS